MPKGIRKNTSYLLIQRIDDRRSIHSQYISLQEMARDNDLSINMLKNISSGRSRSEKYQIVKMTFADTPEYSQNLTEIPVSASEILA